jgi:hypothetical protein
MFKALVLHNSVLRAAKYYNGGFVMEQEGDSFTIAFYSSFDAVVFCLQVRHALLEAHLAALAPVLLLYERLVHASSDAGWWPGS